MATSSLVPLPSSSPKSPPADNEEDRDAVLVQHDSA
jgi:hypothetical protein